MTTLINTPYGIFEPEDALAELYAAKSWTAAQLVAVLDEFWAKARDCARRASLYIVNMTNLDYPKRVISRAKALMRLFSRPQTKSPRQRYAHIEKMLQEVTAQAGKPVALKLSFTGVVKKADLETLLNNHCVSLSSKAERTRLFRLASINPNFDGKEISVKVSLTNAYEAWSLTHAMLKLVHDVKVV